MFRRLGKFIETRLRVRLRSPVDQFLNREGARCDEVIVGVPVMVDDGESEGIGLLVSKDLEQHLLVVDRVEVMPDAAGAVRLLAERCNDKRIHVEARPREVRLGRKIGDLENLEEDYANDLTAVGECVWVLTSLSFQALDSETPPPFLNCLWLGGVLSIVGGFAVKIIQVVLILVLVGRRLGGR
jgi:hypothetical protein